MDLEIGALTRYTAAAPPDEARPPRPPALSDLLVVMIGNSGESVGCRIRALGTSDGVTIAGCGINNDGLAPRPLMTRMPDGTTLSVPPCERLILRGDNPRDQLLDYPLLEQRYEALLRGISVLETYPRAGYGGHGHPAISALDIDLHITPILALLRQALHRRRYRPLPASSGRLATRRQNTSTRRGNCAGRNAATAARRR